MNRDHAPGKHTHSHCCSHGGDGSAPVHNQPEDRSVLPALPVDPVCGMAPEPMIPDAGASESEELTDKTLRFRVSVFLIIPLILIAMGDHLFASIFYKRFDTNADRMATQVGVMGMRFMSGMGMGYAMMVRNDEHNMTGFAIVNTSNVEMTATLTLKNPDGTTFASQDLTLQPGHQVVDILSNFFTGVADMSTFEGTMEIRTDAEGMVPLGLVNTDGIQTAIPLVMIPDAIDHSGMPGGGMGGMN